MQWRKRVLSWDGHQAFFLTEKALQQHDLTHSDDKQQDRFAEGPESDIALDVVRPDAIVRFPEPVPGLRLRYHLQDFMDGHARWFQLWRQKNKNKTKHCYDDDHLHDGDAAQLI